MSDTETIPEVSLKDLDPRLRKQVENAQKSADKNPTYAIDVCMGILQRNPGCLEVREILRKAQRRAKGAKTSGLTKFIGSVTSAPFAMKAGNQIKKDPKAVLESAEKMISANPANATAHKMLGQAAEALGLWNTAVFAYQDIKSLDAENMDNRVALGNALLEAGRAKDAILEGDAIMAANPANEEGQELVRRASVAESMERGKWEDDSDFRDKLKDEEASIELEQASRVANDEEVLEKLVEKNIKRIEEEPENLNHYREVISAYRQMGQIDLAIEYVDKARATVNGRSDPTLERQASDLRITGMRARVEELNKRIADDPFDADATSDLEKVSAELHAFRLKNARELVEKYPNDYATKYELGELLLEEGDYDGAIQEFQLAQRNPKVRSNALLSLGRAYLKKEFFDIAVEQLALAKKEIPLMNELKKEAIYELALAYELMGNEEEAIGEYKIIYQNDIGYRDVSDKINNFYAKRSKKA
ncbi:tetratricopeptide repeat protein [Rubellicoccus peritrichatus]|uniref:Tetratricopeptide repeat protein n=1 Tax=Rubellicoccus peritrichatus TaxID=3080537 RepID=A0AAQ3L5J3_9BACT|nr:tetratricopeptide repeat protein [Puniceicoccus sp. CR14]WOO39824.1 tetratricopeptide repeat protein [Puniceicoccus sp. CR14]